MDTRVPRVILVADMRSPHSRGWLTGLSSMGYEIAVVSSKSLEKSVSSDLEAIPGVLSVEHPRDPLSWVRQRLTKNDRSIAMVRGLVRRKAGARGEGQRLRPEGTQFGEFLIESLIARHVGFLIRRRAQKFEPDLVHALRIPFEAVAVYYSGVQPYAVNTWGQDLIVQAAANPRLERLSRRILGQASAISADCERDLEVAVQMGAETSCPMLMVAGNMGYDETIFTTTDAVARAEHLVTMPRGGGSHIQVDTWLTAIQLVAKACPNASFLSIGISPESYKQQGSQARAVNHEVLPFLSTDALTRVFQASEFVVSPATSDGTPNSVLEAMACGAIPLVSDTPSLRALLRGPIAEICFFDAGSSESMANVLIRALSLPEEARQTLRKEAIAIAAQWSSSQMRPLAANWYQQIWMRRQVGATGS